MDPRPLRFLAEACGGELSGTTDETPVTRVSTDSRTVQRGDLFVALTGEHFNGHDFVTDALAKGAVAAVVSASQAARYEGAALLRVAEPRVALGQMAERYRREFTLPIVGIGGSNGKTTTKELIGTILGGCFEVLRSEASFNNDVGVPLTLLRLETRHVAAVLEVGTNHPGELAPLVRLVQPRLGVVTHVGEEHMEFFGDLSGVIQEEGSLAELLPPDGVLVIPGDGAWAPPLVARTRARIVRVGEGGTNDWRLLERESDAHGTTFAVRAPDPARSGEYRINILGRHQVTNALLALAVGTEFGLGREELQRGMARCQPPKGRMNVWEFDGVRVIDDSYNANVDSTCAALEALRDYPCPGRRAAVLGGMAELGAHTVRAHHTVGRRAAELGIDRLIAIGEPAALAAEAALEAGLRQAIVVDAVETAASSLCEWMRPGDCILIKGSRAARLERLGTLLRSRAGLLRHAA